MGAWLNNRQYDALFGELKRLRAREKKQADRIAELYRAQKQRIFAARQADEKAGVPTEAEVEAAARIIANLRAVDHSKEVLPLKYYRDVARVVLGAAAKVREGQGASRPQHGSPDWAVDTREASSPRELDAGLGE